MAERISPRLAAIVEALPLRSGMRVLEIGCGPGVAARAVARRIGKGHVLAIDRSAKAIAQATAASRTEAASGLLEFRCVSMVVTHSGRSHLVWPDTRPKVYRMLPALSRTTVIPELDAAFQPSIANVAERDEG